MPHNSTRLNRLRGLYGVTPDMDDTPRLLALVEQSLQGGVRILQYRHKTASSRLRIQQASRLHALCQRYKVPLIINDHIKLCLALDAEGVHLGGTDGDLRAARERIGEKILGASCYSDWARALAASEAGVDYVAFGACFASGTKPNAPQADLSLFARPLPVPKVAIGGITLENAEQVVSAGADAIAVVGALYGADDVARQAHALSQVFKI